MYVRFRTPPPFQNIISHITRDWTFNGLSILKTLLSTMQGEIWCIEAESVGETTKYSIIKISTEQWFVN